MKYYFTDNTIRIKEMLFSKVSILIQTNVIPTLKEILMQMYKTIKKMSI